MRNRYGWFVGLCFCSLATGEVRFADLMERTIYNSVLSGVNLRGDKWTYTNPLRWHGLDDHLLYGHDEHERFEPGRTRICCPTNLLRTTLSWHNVLYTTNASGLWLHQYGGNALDTTLFGANDRVPDDAAAQKTADRLKSILDDEKGKAQFIKINEDVKRLALKVQRAMDERKKSES